MARRPTYRRSRRKVQAEPGSILGDSVRDLITSGLSRAKKARGKRRGLTSLQKIQRKARRSALAFLKRKGLAPKGKSRSAQNRTIRKFKPVIEKSETAYTLPEDFPKKALRDLKRAGYKVEKGRLILPRGQYSRKGKVYARPQGKRAGGLVQSKPLTKDFEAEIRAAFEGLKEGDWVGFSLYGNNSYSIYSSAEGMLRDLMGLYQGVDFAKAGVLTIFRIKDKNAYQRNATERRLDNERRSRERRNERRRVARSGLRIRRKNVG